MVERINRYCKYAISTLKLVIASIIVRILYRKLLKKNIWLIKEKSAEARDNGYHLYKYLCENHPEINSYYVIKYDSVDRHKVECLGHVVNANSFLHYLMYVAAKNSIGSQPFGAAPAPTILNYKLKKLCRKDQKVIFLQHGIIKDDLPALYYSKTHFDLFVTSTRQEYDFVVDRFGYPYERVKLLGLCRFDNLYLQQKTKTILVMPTFRKELAAQNREKPAKEYEKEVFMDSLFYKGFSNLLDNEKLNEILIDYGYKLFFYMHFSLQSYNECFMKYSNDNIIIADRFNYDVQQLLLESSVLITDFSSVFFDFAYMNKPEIFFQPDEKDYRVYHYSKGYYDYYTDGFGPVYSNVEDTVDYLAQLIQHDCIMEDKYKDRVNCFFSLHDRYNCERTYYAIRNLV